MTTFSGLEIWNQFFSSSTRVVYENDLLKQKWILNTEEKSFFTISVVTKNYFQIWKFWSDEKLKVTFEI